MKPTEDEFAIYYMYDRLLVANPKIDVPDLVLLDAASRIDSMCREDAASHEFIEEYLHDDGRTLAIEELFQMIDAGQPLDIVWKHFSQMHPSEMGAAIKLMLAMA